MKKQSTTTPELKPGQFEHKGVIISMDSSGQFSARIKGRFERRASLSAVKKLIDSKDEFVPFEALKRERYGGKLEVVKVVGRVKSRGRYMNGKFEWLLEGGGTTSHLFPVSEKAKILAHDKLSKDTDREIEKLRAKLHESSEALRTLDPDKDERP